MSTSVWMLSVRVGTVPLMKSSFTVATVYGPGRSPLNASTLAVTRPDGAWKLAIGRPWLMSVRIRDQTGADDASDRTWLFGVESELPIQTPTARAGAFGSDGGAR